ncbi:MAG: mandelate racemase, partial [Pseudomonadota bacterium]
MKIARIEIYQVDLPYSGGTYTLSGGRTYDRFDATFARVITRCGLDGWGESTPFGATYIAAHGGGVRAGLAELAPAMLGRDPRLHDRLYDAMEDALVGYPHAKTPLDVACWDIAGKAFGLPVCDLLGGRVPGPVPIISSIYASDDPSEMRARVAAHRAQGFMGHSIKIGASEAEGGPKLDADRITACLADRKPGEWFQADANGGMTPEQVMRLIALLPPDIDLVLEAPCATWTETLRLRDRC